MISLESFILLTSTIIICQGTSSSNKKGICKVPALENGHHMPKKDLFNIGEWMQYHCDEGYMTAQRNIVENIQCLSSGWSEVPQCSGITCPLQQTDNLHLVYSNGSVSKFSCNNGFILQGLEISQCYYYGWDPPLPTCKDSGERIKCPPPPQPMNVQVIKPKSDYFSGDSEILKCKPGFQLHGSQSIICKDGQWTSPPQCVRFHECGDPPSIPFGKPDLATVKPKYQSGFFVTYKCNNGFEMTGLPEIVCINGKWSLPPACISNTDSCQLSIEKISLNNLVLPKSVSVHKPLSNGASIPTRCKTGNFLASPSSEMECLNGKMIYPKCTEEKPCRINQEILDENFLELDSKHDYRVFFEHGEIIHFMCKVGYTTISDTTGLCFKEEIYYPYCRQI
ncbi:coagulation factor XIII B chain-like isoform X1 [Engystomops pustulosus]|uniref:coagulation factor XIII B chain-like isoform X1 n=1 Tax=Engystomops pustulosus TaxID=76066 RepID=UPI003AFA5468